MYYVAVILCVCMYVRGCGVRWHNSQLEYWRIISPLSVENEIMQFFWPSVMYLRISIYFSSLPYVQVWDFRMCFVPSHIHVLNRSWLSNFEASFPKFCVDGHSTLHYSGDSFYVWCVGQYQPAVGELLGCGIRGGGNRFLNTAWRPTNWFSLVCSRKFWLRWGLRTDGLRFRWQGNYFVGYWNKIAVTCSFIPGVAAPLNCAWSKAWCTSQATVGLQNNSWE
jgi:hypothetical protein